MSYPSAIATFGAAATTSGSPTIGMRSISSPTISAGRRAGADCVVGERAVGGHGAADGHQGRQAHQRQRLRVELARLPTNTTDAVIGQTGVTDGQAAELFDVVQRRTFPSPPSAEAPALVTRANDAEAPDDLTVDSSKPIVNRADPTCITQIT